MHKSPESMYPDDLMLSQLPLAVKALTVKAFVNAV
jgi:hypothetical protein